MGELTLSQGRLFGALYESILYGISCVLFVGMLYLFGKQETTSLSQRVRCGVICVIFALCTVHLAAVMRGLQLAFFESHSSDAFFNDHTQAVDLIQKSVYAAATFLGDGLLIHRLYVIFGHDWKAIVLPTMSLSATTALWIALIRTYHLSKPGSTLYFPTILHLAPPAFATSFFTNVIITGMIVVRIKLAMRAIKHLNNLESVTFYRRFMAYTVESGLLYPAALFATGVLFLLKDNGLEILSGSNTQLIGIVPILLTLQLRLDLSIFDAAVKKLGPSETRVSTLRFGSSIGGTRSEPLSEAVDLDIELATNGHGDLKERRPPRGLHMPGSTEDTSESVPSLA